jgi:hypothetical protein
MALDATLVLAVIDAQADASGWARLYYDELAAAAGCPRRTLARVVADMVAAGVLERRGGGGRSKATEFRVTPETVPETVPKPGQRAGNRAKTVPKTGAKPCQNRAKTGPETVPPGALPVPRYPEKQKLEKPSDLRSGEVSSSPTLLPPSLPVFRADAVIPAAAEGVEVLDAIRAEVLDLIVADVVKKRDPPPTRRQLPTIRRVAGDRLRAGWHPDLIVIALATCWAFSDKAIDVAAHKVRQQLVGDPGSRLTRFEQQERRR